MNRSNFKYRFPRPAFLMAACMFFALITTISKGQIPAQDSTGFHFWYSGFDARSMALANTTVADRLNNNSLYANPATMLFHSRLSMLAAHSMYNSNHNILIENFTAFFSEGQNSRFAIGGTIFHQGFSGLQTAGNRFSFNHYEFDVAYAGRLSSTLSFGVKWNSTVGSTAGDDAWTNNARLGFLYAPSPMVSYGIVYKGTGYQNNWLGSGLSYYRTNADDETQIAVMELPQRLEVGATLNFQSLGKYPDFVLSFANEKLFGEPGLIYRGALEIYVQDLITLRGGYFHTPQVQGPRVGIGLLFDPVTLNYSYAENNADQTGRSHQLSITVNIQ